MLTQAEKIKSLFEEPSINESAIYNVAQTSLTTTRTDEWYTAFSVDELGTSVFRFADNSVLLRIYSGSEKHDQIYCA